MIYSTLEIKLEDVLVESTALVANISKKENRLRVGFETPKSDSHGHLASNLMMRLSKELKKAPKVLAQEVVNKMQLLLKEYNLDSWVHEIQVEGPGFINITFSTKANSAILNEILNDDVAGEKIRYGSMAQRDDDRVLVEYVSANPTGPLTIAHGRQAAIGDCLVRLFKFRGYKANSEYYNNDVGVQIQLLGESLRARCCEELGLADSDLPENGYKGQYLIDLAKEFINGRDKDFFENKEFATQQCAVFAKNKIMQTIQEDLLAFGVEFDSFYSQETLQDSGKVEETLGVLKEKGVTREEEGALWLESTRFGDDKDRVLIKSDKAYTYLMPDIAYHHDKYCRGYSRLVDILGPDHHGYIARLKASQEALGNNPKALDVLIAQLVTLYEGKKQLRMSTRAGEFITLSSLIREIGKDAARFFFILRKCDSHLDFDLDLAKKASSENPVYYIQYAHARVTSIKKTCQLKRVDIDYAKANCAYLNSIEEERLLKAIKLFPKKIQACCDQLEPHLLVEYLQNLAALFHQFYQKRRIADQPIEVASARMMLAEAVQKVLKTGLNLLGVSAPEKM